MITVTAVRRFNLRENGTAMLCELVRELDLPAMPQRGDALEMVDGSGDVHVATIRMLAYPSPRQPGVYGVSITVRCVTEPPERMAPALATGWQKLCAVADPLPDPPRAA